MAKTSTNLADQEKTLLDWAFEGLFFDDAPRFLDFCKRSDYEAMDVIPYHEFLTLKEKFEA